MPKLSIYLSEERHKVIVQESKESGKSVSRVLSDRAFGDLTIDPSADLFLRLDRIEEKLNSLEPTIMLPANYEHKEYGYNIIKTEDGGLLIEPL